MFVILTAAVHLQGPYQAPVIVAHSLAICFFFFFFFIWFLLDVSISFKGFLEPFHLLWKTRKNDFYSQSFHCSLPVDRHLWQSCLVFIFWYNLPSVIGKWFCVSSAHFTADCLLNKTSGFSTFSSSIYGSSFKTSTLVNIVSFCYSTKGIESIYKSESNIQSVLKLS